jgi:hypothetical protein
LLSFGGFTNRNLTLRLTFSATWIIAIIVQCIGFQSSIAKDVRPSIMKPMNSGLEGWRLGVGTGYALYLGDQMDYAITRNYYGFKELRPNITLGAYKQINEDTEWGLVFKRGSFQTLKSSNTQGLQCDYVELQTNWQKSLNDNIEISGKPVSINFQVGFGFMNYKSRYFVINPNFISPDGALIQSSVGYGYKERKDIMGNPYEDISNRRFTLVGNIGLNLGIRLNRNLRIYWENSVQVSGTSKLSGNLEKVAKIPPDGYFYSGLTIHMRFGVGGGRLGCPRF